MITHYGLAKMAPPKRPAFSYVSLGMIWYYIDVIMTTMASQITSLTVVYAIVYSGADQRKHQSSASLAFMRGIHWDRWIPHTKGQLRGKCFHLMTSSWVWYGMVLCDVMWQDTTHYTLTYGMHIYRQDMATRFLSVFMSQPIWKSSLRLD